ncbi:MAG: ATP-binding protein [Lachnospiraceae bacterium]|nr:ATP-binding protein [Lachnospiraceae bacterium]
MDYITRIIDEEIDRKAEAFNAINIVGPKGCGKTRTARERCKTIIEFQDEEKRDGYITIAETSPGLFLKNEKPILFDEWQDAPKIWGAIRKSCDDNPEAVGEYYLTGSTSRKVRTPHTGTGRITEITMYPMTLSETGESNGRVSFGEMLNNPVCEIDGISNSTSLEDLFFAACRGGWPRCLHLKTPKAKLEIARDYYNQIYKKDISAVDGVKRNPEWARTILWSYARNMATTAKKTNIYADIKASHDVSDATIASYIEVLESLFVIKDIDAWTPQIRSKTAIRAAKKHIFVDPSIGLAALDISPEYFNTDLDMFGHVLENMVLRDLLVFAEREGARVMHYSDDMGLEADAVYQLRDGRYALIEIKTGANAIPAAEKNLLKFKDLIVKHNEAVLSNTEHPGVTYREPDLLIIICANAPMAYTTEKGVKVVPVGVLGK